MEIIYNNTIVSDQFLTPRQTQYEPIVSLKGLDTNKKYTLIMYDPNAVNGNFIHWIVTNIHGNEFNTGKELLPYKGPSPPKGSKIHNYIFSLYEKNNNILVQLDENKRIIKLNKLLDMLYIKENPIYVKRFSSEYLKGGRYRRKTPVTRRQKNRKKKNTKRNNKY